MLDGLRVARVRGEVVLVCPAHPNAPLRGGGLAIAGAPNQFSKHCSVDGCNNLAYSATEETLRKKVQDWGQQIRP